MKNFCDIYSVSRETFSKLEKYCQAIIEWQSKMNLVSKSSLQDIWKRHIEDSAQLFNLIPATAKNLLDIGSGAGFPGMVIAIISAEKTPYLNITLTESITKKTLFLNYTKDLLHLENTNILNTRVETIKNKKFSIITARAVTNLVDLLEYSYQLLDKNGLCIFPKGKSYKEEIEQAKKQWQFSLTIVDSQTSEEGKILVINKLTKKRSAKCRE